MKRTPVKTGVQEIDKIPTFENIVEETKNARSIKYTHNNHSFQTKVTNNIASVENRCWAIFRSAKDDEWTKIWNIFVHAHLGHNTNSNIYITSDDMVLKNRDHFVNHPIDKPVNILSIEEGREVMDIFAKNLGFCFLAAGSRTSFTDYYVVALRSNLPHYQDPSPFDELINTNGTILDTLANRFVYLLKCIDKMGINYYHGMNYDISNDNHFYFNYFVVLITGIFDSLALYTEKKYEIKIGKKRIPNRISLQKKTGRCFLKKVRKLNPDLYNHIAVNTHFINLVYIFRESIIHREFKVPLTYYALTGMEDSIIKIEPRTATCLSRLGDKKSRYDEYTEWGHTKDTFGEYISPYLFSKKAALHLIDFVDQYLEKLGFDNFVTGSSETVLRRRALEFQKEGLSYKSLGNTLKS